MKIHLPTFFRPLFPYLIGFQIGSALTLSEFIPFHLVPDELLYHMFVSSVFPELLCHLFVFSCVFHDLSTSH